jgi:hypothetical protein
MRNFVLLQQLPIWFDLINKYANGHFYLQTDAWTVDLVFVIQQEMRKNVHDGNDWWQVQKSRWTVKIAHHAIRIHWNSTQSQFTPSNVADDSHDDKSESWHDDMLQLRGNIWKVLLDDVVVLLNSEQLVLAFAPILSHLVWWTDSSHSSDTSPLKCQKSSWIVWNYNPLLELLIALYLPSWQVRVCVRKKKIKL